MLHNLVEQAKYWKRKRRKCDWKRYNKQLINRANVNFWVTKKSLKFWKAKKKKKAGRPFIYNDQSDADGPLQLPTSTKGTGEGFFQFLSNLMDIPKVPSYTQICRRMRSIQLPEELMNKRNVED